MISFGDGEPSRNRFQSLGIDRVRMIVISFLLFRQIGQYDSVLNMGVLLLQISQYFPSLCIKIPVIAHIKCVYAFCNLAFQSVCQKAFFQCKTVPVTE